MFCPNCGLANDNAARFCYKCGTSFSSEPMQFQTPVPAGRNNSMAKNIAVGCLVAIVCFAGVLIVLSVAIPQMGKGRINAQELAAMQDVQTINKAEIQYHAQFGVYATSLAQLGPPTSAGAAEGPQAAGLIPGKLASSASGGYKFTVTATPTGYAISAVPKSFGKTGRRTFYSDETAVMRQNWTQDPATASSAQLK